MLPLSRHQPSFAMIRSLIFVRTAALVFFLVAASHSVYSQNTASLDNIIETLYASISGDAGEPRKWKSFDQLFTENAMLVPVRKTEDGRLVPQSMTPSEYKSMANDWLVQNGFHEVEIHRVVETYGPVTHVFSTYESRNKASDPEPFARGINSIQLLNDGERWWIMTIYWSQETPENPIPDKYLPK